MARQGIILSFGDAVSTTGTTAAAYPLGTMRLEESATSGRGCEVFRYVYQNEATVTPVAGGIAYGGNTLGNMWEVGMDVSDVASGFARGVYQSVLGNTKYGWVKTKGYEATLMKAKGTALNWTAGAVLHAAPNASQDGMAKIFKSNSTGGSKVSATELKAALQRVVGWAASTALSTTAVGKAYIDLE